MPTAADLEERAIWQLKQAGYAVTAQGNQGYLVTNATGATPASLDELRRLADTFYELVWLGYKRVTTGVVGANISYPLRRSVRALQVASI